MKIKDHSYLGTVSNDFDLEVTVGDYCSIGNGLTIIGSEHPPVFNPKVVSTYPFAEKFNVGDYTKCGVRGGINIGNDVWIGQNVTILDGVTIGDGVIIGAGSVVTKDIGDYQIWGGNPAKFIKFRFNPWQRKALKEISWWNWDENKIRENLSQMDDISLFIQKYAN